MFPRIAIPFFDASIHTYQAVHAVGFVAFAGMGMLLTRRHRELRTHWWPLALLLAALTRTEVKAESRSASEWIKASIDARASLSHGTVTVMEDIYSVTNGQRERSKSSAYSFAFSQDRFRARHETELNVVGETGAITREAGTTEFVSDGRQSMGFLFRGSRFSTGQIKSPDPKAWGLNLHPKGLGMNPSTALRSLTFSEFLEHSGFDASSATV